MTFTDLQTEATALAELGGFANTATPPVWADLVNFAYVDLCWEAEAIHGPETTFNTVINQAEYALASPEWKVVLDVIYNSGYVQRTSEAVIRREDPLWLTAVANTPTRYWVPRQGTIRLHPKPNAVNVVTVYGVRAPTPLSGGTDVPVAPATYHRAIAVRAAWRHMRKYARQEDAALLNQWAQEFQDAVESWKQELADAMYMANSPRYVQEVIPESVYV